MNGTRKVQTIKRRIALLLWLPMLLLALTIAFTAVAEPEPLVWDFNDGQGEWSVEGSWAYAAGFGTENVTYDAQRQGLRLSGLSFDPAVSWSEIKLNVPLRVDSLLEYGRFTFDLRVQTAQLTQGGKELLVQPTAIMAGGTYQALTSGGPVSSATADDGTTLLHYELSFVSDLRPDSVTVGIVGANTAYAGDMWLEYASLTAIPSGEAIGVDPTVEPINGRAKAAIEPDLSCSFQLVDEDATEATKRMYAYLRGASEGNYILFGHQNALQNGITITRRDGTQSDVLSAVGAQPAIIGIDGLNLVGSQADWEQSVMLAQAAHRQGAWLTLCAHMPNFTTGGDFRDVQAGAIADVLPGGGAHDKLTAYLDVVAEFALACVDDDGNAIPVLFRPYHENNGAWFWWGSKGGTAEEYQQLFRFTVEYFRDVRQVHSFLYAYSPNGPFAGEAQYLQRYPGDSYVDVLGMDDYCDNASTSLESWITKLLKSCDVITQLAAQRGKIPALTETGVRQINMGYEGLAPKDNGACREWYCTLLDALMAHRAGQKLSYFLVWANFSEDMFWVPYRRVGTCSSHECIDDFIRFYNDDRTVFADRIGLLDAGKH